jgi:hypothetical protein
MRLAGSICRSSARLHNEGEQVIDQPICPLIFGEVCLCARPAHQALGTFVIVGR